MKADFSNLFEIADDIDQRVAAYRIALPEKAFELDQIAAASLQFREQAQRMQNYTIQTAPTEDLMEVHKLMVETLGLIRLFHVDQDGTVQ